MVDLAGGVAIDFARNAAGWNVAGVSLLVAPATMTVGGVLGAGGVSTVARHTQPPRNVGGWAPPLGSIREMATVDRTVRLGVERGGLVAGRDRTPDACA